MLKTFLPWLIRTIPMGGYRTFIISILLVLVGTGMFAAAFFGWLPPDVAIGVAATTILLGLQGFFGRAATAELESQLSLALAIIVDTHKKVNTNTPAIPEIPLTTILDIREGEGDNINKVRGDAKALDADSQATGQGWQ